MAEDSRSQAHPADDPSLGVTEIVYRCSDCGWTQHRSEPLPQRCPACGAPREHFVLVTED